MCAEAYNKCSKLQPQLKIDGGIIPFTTNLLKTNKEILWHKQRGRFFNILSD